MNRIDKTLARLKASGKKMLSPYLTAGDPTPEATVPLLHTLVAAGADILELGIPFSDPMTEGPVIQQAMERALLHAVSCRKVLDMVQEFRQHDNNTPVVIMGYVNPIEQFGYRRFAREAAEAGVDGSILVDMPPEESQELARIWDEHGLYGIYLCSPTTTKERMQLINQYAKGYLYYVSLKGVTGASNLDLVSLKAGFQECKKQTGLPLMVGFGIKTPKRAAEVAEFSDGVIVGAALITEIAKAFEAQKNYMQAAAALTNSMRLAIDNQGIQA